MDERITAIRERVANAVALILEDFVIEILEDGWLLSRVGEISTFAPPSRDISSVVQSILCAAETHFALAAAREQGLALEVPASAISRVECDER